MSKLEPYLIRKRAVLEQRQADFQADARQGLCPSKPSPGWPASPAPGR